MAFGSTKRKRSEIEAEAQHDDEGAQVDGVANDDANAIDSGDEDCDEEPAAKRSTGNPLLSEITILDGPKGKNDGRSKRWRCNHCKQVKKSSLTRVRVHLIGPKPGRKADVARCQVLMNNATNLKELRDKVNKAEEGSSKTGATKLPTTMVDAFGTVERDAVDLKTIKFICANGIPFNVLRSPYFSEMVSAINRAPKGYKGPSSEKARTTLLDACKRNVENELATVRDTWYTHGVSVVSDGWTNIKNMPLINVIASNSRGSCFLYAEDYSGVEKTGEAIAEFLLKAIDDIGPSNVLQVVTDNASNCKAAGKEIEKVHTHIFWAPCVVHTLNLMFKDFATSFPWMLEKYKEGKAIVKFFQNHSHCLAMFRNNSDLDLLREGKTRFATHFILLERLSACREALSTTIVTNQWKDWMKSSTNDLKQQAKAVVQSINNEDFWSEVEMILTITRPVYLVLRFSDGEGPKMGEIYERMDNMLGEIKDIMTKVDNPHRNDFPQVQSIVLARWEKMHIPLHCLAYALCPKYYDKTHLESIAPRGIKRKSPNLDKEVMAGVMKAFDRIGDNESEQKVLREQFKDFIMKKGMYALPAVKADAKTMDPIDWWNSYGSETPELAEVAKRILSQPISSSSAERVWSTYQYIHNAKRNKLNAKNADKLVYIHSNLRLLSRFTESYKKGPHSKWDVDPVNSII